LSLPGSVGTTSAGQRSMRAPQVDWHAALTDWAFRSSIFAEDQCEAIMSKVRNKEYQALLKESAKCSTKQIACLVLMEKSR
jgi:hypothetical protein